MIVRCPICRKSVDWPEGKWKPFCSERCKMTDLGSWASGDYYIAGRVQDEEDERGNDQDMKEDMKSW